MFCQKNNHFRILTNSSKEKSHPFTFSSALCELIPVLPRRKIIRVKSDNESKIDDNNHSLCYISRPLTNLQRIPITTRIVIVGSSDTALSFLETLIYG